MGKENKSGNTTNWRTLSLKPRRASSGPLVNIRGRFPRTGWEEGMPVFKEDHIKQSLNCERSHYYLEAAIATE